VIDFHLPVDQAVSAPRVHHQWQPDELSAEPGISPEILDGLVKRRHKVVLTPPQTSANSIEITADGYVGAADRRTRGSLAAGY
jgi:gamma-glutamyltranspeptidase/glutathione hydrolase